MATVNFVDCTTGEISVVEIPDLPPTPEEIDAKWAEIRAERNALLAACDWTQLPDAPVDAAPWAVYRQELRDITTQADPFNIVWPTQPGA